MADHAVAPKTWQARPGTVLVMAMLAPADPDLAHETRPSPCSESTGDGSSTASCAAAPGRARGLASVLMSVTRVQAGGACTQELGPLMSCMIVPQQFPSR